MHDRVGAALDRHFKASAHRTDDDLVFCHPHTGGPLDSSKVLKRFRAALEAAGVRRLRFYDLPVVKSHLLTEVPNSRNRAAGQAPRDRRFGTAMGFQPGTHVCVSCCET
jgi:hypothetical protein